MCLKDTRKFIFLTLHLARVQFLSKDTEPVKRKVKIGGKSEICDFEDAPPSRQLVLSQVENRRKYRCLRRRSQFHMLKHEETSNFSHSV